MARKENLDAVKHGCFVSATQHLAQRVLSMLYCKGPLLYLIVSTLQHVLKNIIISFSLCLSV